MSAQYTSCFALPVTVSLRLAIAGLIGGAMLTVLAWQVRAETGEWSALSIRNDRPKSLKIYRQPRPSSTPTGGYDGYAIAFTGTIETVKRKTRVASVRR